MGGKGAWGVLASENSAEIRQQVARAMHEVIKAGDMRVLKQIRMNLKVSMPTCSFSLSLSPSGLAFESRLQCPVIFSRLACNASRVLSSQGKQKERV